MQRRDQGTNVTCVIHVTSDMQTWLELFTSLIQWGPAGGKLRSVCLVTSTVKDSAILQETETASLERLD